MSERPAPAKCPVPDCGEMFDSIRALKIHMSKVHNAHTITTMQIMDWWGYEDIEQKRSDKKIKIDIEALGVI